MLIKIIHKIVTRECPLSNRHTETFQQRYKRAFVKRATIYRREAAHLHRCDKNEHRGYIAAYIARESKGMRFVTKSLQTRC